MALDEYANKIRDLEQQHVFDLENNNDSKLSFDN